MNAEPLLALAIAETFSIPIQISTSSGVWGLVMGLGWLVYVLIYWVLLVRILRARRFEAAEKILWFLVITMAPVIGILTFWWLCPPFVLNGEDRPEERPEA